MSKPKKLLMATDFSVRGRRAGKTAIEWAQRTGAELHWVHCAEALPSGVKPSAAPMLSNYVDRARHYANDQLRESVERSREAGLVSDSQIVNGDPVEAVVAHAREIGADCIIVSSHGHTGLKRVWLGSVAEGVVHDADCNVLVVRGPDSPFATFPILVGDDLTDYSARARETALSIAQVTGAPIEFVHSLDLGIAYLSNLEVVVPSALFTKAYDEAAERLEDAATAVGDVKIVNRVVGEPPTIALCERAEETQAGLIVVGTHSREGINRVLLGSVAQSVVRRSPCSVLVAKGAAGTSS